jgi:single-stranded-DNA-specific exonuclease
MRRFLVTGVGLVALATVADVVPLLDENRIFVRHGLSSLKGQPTPGLSALMGVTDLDQKPRLESEDIAFTLAPRLNAAGRLGQAPLGVELLLTESEERAQSLAHFIQKLNRERERLERSVYLAANRQVTEQFDPSADAALVLAGRGWHQGVIGIVAGRLAEKYCRPVVLIALDALASRPGTGSARTAGGLKLNQALLACGQHLVSHGGHAAAAGLRIDETRIQQFREEFCRIAEERIAPLDRQASIHIEAETSLSALTLKTLGQIDQLAPFGHRNPRPLLCTSEVMLAGEPRRVGSGERHLSLQLEQHGITLKAVAFGRAEWADELAKTGGPFDIAYRPAINLYRNRRSVELQLVDWRRGNEVVE